MIDFYFWTTPNGYKILIFLEESGIPYRIIPVNISKGEQFESEFLQISPNNKIPAIIDSEPKGGGAPIKIFESGAILLYLAEKSAQFIPSDLAARTEVMKWLFWQVGGLGPMLGQYQYFHQYAMKRIPSAIERYKNETERLFSVLNKKLENSQYVSGEYSIADMACYPWILKYPFLGLQLDNFPDLKRWADQLIARPAIIRAYKKGAEINSIPTITRESMRFLFGSETSHSAE